MLVARPLAAAEFIALLNVGCTATKASATTERGAWKVTLDQRVVAIDATGAASVE